MYEAGMLWGTWSDKGSAKVKFWYGKPFEIKIDMTWSISADASVPELKNG
jgi:hypothetical protein